MRRLEILVFALAWLTFAWFHQGGGWNQNGRFALTRALVEQRKPFIDDYLVYQLRDAGAERKFARVPVRDGIFELEGHTQALAWYAGGGPLVPLSPRTPAEAALVPVDAVAATGDIAFARGHVHPNKAPGASFAAVPAYALLYGIERLCGLDVDRPEVLNVNAWLCGVGSVGWIAALGVVAFFRVARRWSGDDRAALFAAAAFAFGSLYFPYATMLYDHDLVAAALLGAVLLAQDRRLVAAGACCGAAIVASYLSVIAGAIVGAYIVFRHGWKSATAVALGSLPPLLLLGAYNLACFGRVMTTNYAWQNPLFKDAQGSALDVFTAPDPGVFVKLLVSPERGLFLLTPVLILGVVGLVRMFRAEPRRAEAFLCAAMIAHVLAFNVTFKAWHGGWAAGPRYLIPMIPFLALPIVFAPKRLAWLHVALLAVSILAMTVVTVVDAQPAWVEWSPASPVWTSDLPRLLGGEVSVNTGSMFEAMPGRFESPPHAFNAGELLGLRGLASLLPWMLVAGGLGYAVKREIQRVP